MGRLAALAAEVIDIGVTVVTAPARWAAQCLRWYAAHADDAPAEPAAQDSDRPAADG